VAAVESVVKEFLGCINGNAANAQIGCINGNTANAQIGCPLLDRPETGSR
jgi:hypothetical protein